VFCLRYPTDSELLHSIVLHFTIPEAVMIEVSAKRFFFLCHLALDTILKLLQSSETQGIKYKKETITTFRILLALFCSKSSQNPTDNASLSYFYDDMSSHQVLPIKDNTSSLLLSSRIFFLLLLSFS